MHLISVLIAKYRSIEFSRFYLRMRRNGMVNLHPSLRAISVFAHSARTNSNNASVVLTNSFPASRRLRRINRGSLNGDDDGGGCEREGANEVDLHVHEDDYEVRSQVPQARGRVDGVHRGGVRVRGTNSVSVRAHAAGA